MFERLELVPVTQNSYPFGSAVGKYNFSENGYSEDEYFMHGTANIYAEKGEASFEILNENVPYCNRFVVRRPSDVSKFSGNVVIEILNATARVDLDRMWVISGEHFMRNGDIYVGITSKPDTFDSLLNFDKERYSKINWKYPGERIVTEKFEDEVLAAPNPENETGLFWDILTDLGLLLKSDNEMNPLTVYGDRKVMLTGWSQSASYMYTYINRLSVNEEYTGGKTIFDGYLAAGGVHRLCVPLNQEGWYHTKLSDPLQTKIKYMPLPYIAAQTESENAHFGSFECRQEDSDTENFKYRIYEIAGSTHDNKQTLLDYYHNDASLSKRGGGPKYMGEHDFPCDFPYQFPFNALYSYLFSWVNDGVAPPSFERIEVDEELNNVTDKNGNAIGGMRTPFVNCPSCAYVPYSNINGAKFGLFGHVLPFSTEELEQKYGNLENYRKLVEEDTYKCIKEGYILAADREEIIETAVASASERGLK